MKGIDGPSFHLGMINCFAEMVAVGVKPLAISPPLEPGEYERIREASDTIVEGSGIHSWLETSLLVTDLQSPEFTRGKWSVLYYSDPEVLEAYRALKTRKGELEGAGRYTAEERRTLSREFMELLGYPPHAIEAKLEARGTDDPFVLPTGE